MRYRIVLKLLFCHFGTVFQYMWKKKIFSTFFASAHSKFFFFYASNVFYAVFNIYHKQFWHNIVVQPANSCKKSARIDCITNWIFWVNKQWITTFETRLVGFGYLQKSFFFKKNLFVHHCTYTRLTAQRSQYFVCALRWIRFTWCFFAFAGSLSKVYFKFCFSRIIFNLHKWI